MIPTLPWSNKSKDISLTHYCSCSLREGEQERRNISDDHVAKVSLKFLHKSLAECYFGTPFKPLKLFSQINPSVTMIHCCQTPPVHRRLLLATLLGTGVATGADRDPKTEPPSLKTQFKRIIYSTTSRQAFVVAPENLQESLLPSDVAKIYRCC